VLTELPGTRITIEIKSGSAVEPVLAVLERTDSWNRVCLGSFSDGWLGRARSAAGKRLCTSMGARSALGLRSRAWLGGLPPPLTRLPALPVTGNLAQLPRRFGALTVVDPALLRAARAAGREVHVFTVNDPAGMDEMLDMGVDGLLTDRPDRLRDVLSRRGSWS
jgi:glycerophosphoryl diester phosphodiesterase